MAQQFEAPVCVHLAQVVTGSIRRRVMILAWASVSECALSRAYSAAEISFQPTWLIGRLGWSGPRVRMILAAATETACAALRPAAL